MHSAATKIKNESPQKRAKKVMAACDWMSTQHISKLSFKTSHLFFGRTYVFCNHHQERNQREVTATTTDTINKQTLRHLPTHSLPPFFGNR